MSKILISKASTRALSFLSLFIPGKTEFLVGLLGALGVLAFAPFFFSPVILISIIGLFFFWQRAKSRFEGFKLGLWFGFGFFGVGVSWLFSSMYVYSGVLLPVAVLLTGLFVFYLSLFVACAGGLAQYLKAGHHSGFTLVILFPAIWVAFELLRASFLGGYPFLLLGNTHIETWLAGYAPVLGVWGVSWGIVISAGLLLWLYQTRAWIRASLSLALLWSLGGMLQDIEWVKPVGEPVDIALLQGNIPQEEKWVQANFLPTLNAYTSLTQQHLDADVIVWPETAIPAYYDVVEKGVLNRFIKDIQLFNKDVLVGVIAGEQGTQQYFNALVNLNRPDERYYKHHLVPFSEFFPFHGVFDYLSTLFDIPFSTFTHGEYPQPPLWLGGQWVGLSICYEMSFGDELAQYLPKAQYFITVSNDAWFAHTLEPAQQLQDAQMRALELGREVARSTNTGYTAIVDIKGHIKQQIPAYERGVLRGDIQPYEGLTFYAEWGKMPVLFMLFFLFAFILGKRYFLTGRV